VQEIELTATVPEGHPHYDALDTLLLAAGLTAPGTEPDAWNLTVNTGTREHGNTKRASSPPTFARSTGYTTGKSAPQQQR
ncbi:MAG: hypothetical protein P8N02_00495, partial [Actinomycetota bacterium]|nr:hypothetical protein [Actinomycetota bacterium]